MNIAFIGQNIHFAINLLASLALFSVFWLIFDAWTQRRKAVEAIKWLGFLLLAIGFLLSGAVIEQTGVSKSSFAESLPLVSLIFRCVGYALIIAGQIIDPLMKRPNFATDYEEYSTSPKSSAMAVLSPFSVVKLALVPLLPLAAAVLYFRRATTGLEKHLKAVAFAFAGLAIYEFLSVLSLWQDTSNPLIYDLIAVYGPIWWVAQIALLVSSLVFAKWVWQYLAKRLSSQIFIVLLTTTVCIYFASTLGFSYLLLGNTRTQALADLSTASQVLEYAVDSQRAELTAQAEALTSRPQLVAAVQSGEHQATIDAVGTYAAQHKLSSITVTDAEGRVLLRSEDPERWGDSLSDDTLVQRSLIGRTTGSVRTANGVLAPTVALVSSQPIRGANNFVVGSIIITRTVSDAFVDNIKSSTGLDATIYAGDQRSATTLKATDGSKRAIGIKETNSEITKQVLDKGKPYNGEVSFQNRTYLGAYAPLNDADNETVGMLLVARPASNLLAAATRSVELAFIIAVGLLILSIYPVYLVSKKIASSVR